jgi:hypothetical protein
MFLSRSSFSVSLSGLFITVFNAAIYAVVYYSGLLNIYRLEIGIVVISLFSQFNSFKLYLNTEFYVFTLLTLYVTIALCIFISLSIAIGTIGNILKCVACILNVLNAPFGSVKSTQLFIVLSFNMFVIFPSCL